MDPRYRDIFAHYVLSITSLSEQQNPRAALIVRGGIQVGVGFSKDTGTEFDTSPIFEALINSQEKEKSHPLILFCTYFPSLEECIALYSSEIRKIYYMGDITDERSVRFMNKCAGLSFEVIKLEVK